MFNISEINAIDTWYWYFFFGIGIGIGTWIIGKSSKKETQYHIFWQFAMSCAALFVFFHVGAHHGSSQVELATSTLKHMECMTQLCNIDTAYPMCWCRLKEGKYGMLLEQRGLCAEGRMAQVSAADLNWPVGAHVVITAQSPESYLSKDDPTGTGMQPLWLDWTSLADRDTNQCANDTILKGLSAGVEVAAVKAVVDKDGAIQLTFPRPLKLLHDSSRTKLMSTLKDSSKRFCYADTQLHISLLSRNICISTEFNSNSPGERVLKCPELTGGATPRVLGRQLPLPPPPP